MSSVTLSSLGMKYHLEWPSGEHEIQQLFLRYLYSSFVGHIRHNQRLQFHYLKKWQVIFQIKCLNDVQFIVYKTINRDRYIRAPHYAWCPTARVFHFFNIILCTKVNKGKHMGTTNPKTLKKFNFCNFNIMFNIM